MSDILKIETPLLDRDIQNIEEQLGTIKRSLSDMRTAESYLESMWEGSAKDAFRQSFENDCQEIEEIIRLLENYKTELSNASREYVMSSDTVSSIIDSVSI